MAHPQAGGADNIPSESDLTAQTHAVVVRLNHDDCGAQVVANIEAGQSAGRKRWPFEVQAELQLQ